MIEQLPKIIISLIFIAAIIFVAFFVDFGSKKKKGKNITPEEREKIWMSRNGSIIFYVFIGLLGLFFLIMYIKYRMIYG